MFNFLKKKEVQQQQTSSKAADENNIVQAKEEEVKQVNAEEVLQDKGFTSEDIDLYKSVFLLSEPISREKFQSLYALYIGSRFIDDEHEPESIDGLTRDELCVVHNSLNSFIDNCVKMAGDEDLSDELKPVFGYKKELRAEILKHTKAATLYVLISDLNNVPLLNAEAMYIFTNREFAERQLEASGIKNASLSEITPDNFDRAFTEYCEIGFNKAIIDMNCCINISEIFEFNVESSPCLPEACRTMIVLNQIHSNALNTAKKENRELNSDEIRQISALSQGITEALIKAKLILPGEKLAENDNVKISIPVVSFADDSKWIAMFTDKSALMRYIQKQDVIPVALPNLLLEQYKNIRNDEKISGIIINPGREQFRITKAVLDFFENASLSEFERLQKKCNELQTKNENSEELAEALKHLGEMLLESEAVYAAFDKDFNENYPFMGLDGRAELFTTEQRAANAAKHFEQAKQGNFIIRRVDKTQIKDFFEELCGMGINVFRLDNGYMPVEIWLNSFFEYPKNGITDIRNRNMKNMFIRHLQYVSRLKELEADKMENKNELIRAALTLQANAYRELGNGIVYVFIPQKNNSDVALYTEEALKKAEDIIEKNNLSKELLITDNNTKYDIYNGNLSMRVITAKTKESFVCAFTDMEAAEAAQKDFIKHGCNDCIVAVTFDELREQAEQCSGIIMDISTYGLQIMKKDYDKILEYRKAKGNIIVNLEEDEK